MSHEMLRQYMKWMTIIYYFELFYGGEIWSLATYNKNVKNIVRASTNYGDNLI